MRSANERRFVDTDVIVRLLTGDDPVKQRATRNLFVRVQAGQLSLVVPDTVVADAVFVLSSRRLYNLPRAEIGEMLKALLRLPRFRVSNRQTVIEAIELYAATNLDFGDAFIAASMRRAKSEDLYSYDGGFDRLPQVSRMEP
jgi:predicted nucleic acid-binding protein